MGGLDAQIAVDVIKKGWAEMEALQLEMEGRSEIGIVMGMPGTGKTTVVNIVSGKIAHAIRIEAWLSMRLGDLLDEIGTGLGLELRGTLNSRTQKIIRALRQRPDTVILVDEAEYLKKWNVEKLDVLRKLHDNAGVTILLFGTPAIANVLNRRDTTQLSRRMFQYSFSGAKKDEIRQALQGYNMEQSVMERLAAMASDTAHGGMGSYTKMLLLCLYATQGGRITDATLEEAVMYKPGPPLRGRGAQAETKEVTGTWQPRRARG